MVTPIPAAGTISGELAAQARGWWTDAATKAGINLNGFDPGASLPDRLAWAQSKCLEIGERLEKDLIQLFRAPPAMQTCKRCL